MSFGDHTDLIRQVQLSLREEAGLSSYDPHDPTLPSIPSLRELIAALDPPSPDLRCKHCQGRLLRGLQSVICIYCGRRQQRDVKPDPIAFKSTLGYQWLLQSLNLDGSETVGPAFEEDEQRRGQSTAGGEILVSDLLNFQIEWPTELEKPEVDVADNVAVQRTESFDLPDDELDEYFAESRRNFVSKSSEVQPRPEDQSASIQTKAFPIQENVSLFQNIQQSVPLGSSGVEDTDGFSGWQADFQSADSGNQRETSTSSGSFVGPNVDLSFHMDSVFGPIKDMQAEKASDASTPLESATASWMQDDLWSDSNLLASHQAKQVDATIQSKDVVGKDLFSTTTATTSADWFSDDQFQTRSTALPDNKAIKENDDSFDVWNDCATAPETKAVEENDDSFDVWNDCATAPENKETDEYDDSFDDWNDFTSSTRAEDPFKNSVEQSGINVAGADVQIPDNMFTSSFDNFEDIDFGSFAQAELATTSGIQNGSVEANSLPKENHASPRMANIKDEVGLNVGEAADINDMFNSKVSSEQQPDVESLLSQMHDLSFMLKDDLSVPSKQDSPSLF